LFNNGFHYWLPLIKITSLGHEICCQTFLAIRKKSLWKQKVKLNKHWKYSFLIQKGDTCWLVCLTPTYSYVRPDITEKFSTYGYVRSDITDNSRLRQVWHNQRNWRNRDFWVGGNTSQYLKVTRWRTACMIGNVEKLFWLDFRVPNPISWTIASGTGIFHKNELWYKTFQAIGELGYFWHMGSSLVTSVILHHSELEVPNFRFQKQMWKDGFGNGKFAWTAETHKWPIHSPWVCNGKDPQGSVHMLFWSKILENLLSRIF
jgi:hypothetical protein